MPINYERIYSNKAERLIERSKNTNDQNLALYFKCRALPFYCESSVLSMIYQNEDVSDKYINMAMSVVKEVENEQNNHIQSICSYVRGVKAALHKEYDESLEYLKSAEGSYKNSEIKDPLYYSWICCELAYCYNKQSKFDDALSYLLIGFMLHKLFECKNRHIEFIRKYIHHAILSDFEEVDNTTIDTFKDIAENYKNKEEYAESLVCSCEAAILCKNAPSVTYDYNRIMSDVIEISKRFENSNLPMDKSFVKYAKGVDHALKDEFEQALDLLNESKELCGKRTLNDIIFLMFLDREIAYCNYKLNKGDVDTVVLFKEAFKDIEELEWELNLYLRTFGIFYNNIGTRQFNAKQSDGDRTFDKSLVDERTKKFLINEIGLVTEAEVEIQKIEDEMDELSNPLHDFKKSLEYFKRVDDEVLIPSLYLDKSQLFSFGKKFTESRSELENARDAIENIKNKKISNYLNLQYHHAAGYIDQEIGEYESAENHYKKVLEYAGKTGRAEQAKATTHYNLAMILIKLRDYDSAYENIGQSITFSRASDLTLLLVRAYCERARLEVLKNSDFDKAKECINEAKKSLNKIFIGKSKLETMINNRIDWINFVERSRESIECINGELNVEV